MCNGSLQHFLSSSVYAGSVQGFRGITRLVPEATRRIDRWTDFVEIGPLVVGQTNPWRCLRNLLSATGNFWKFLHNT